MSFLEDYTLLDELGQGGYATVYKVRHNKLGYIRATRVLNTIIAHGEEDKTYQKFLEECRILLRLGNGNHPNIVHIYQPLLREQKAIVEMDYVDGADLFHYLKKCAGFVEIKDILKLLSDISSALAYCHEDIYKFCMDKDEDSLKDDPNDGSKLLIDEQTRERLIKKYRVIHNDIHSGNIIRRENGSYVLLDFGLAIEGDNVVRSSRKTNGAPEFKAPEKWDNNGTLTTQSDIYSFGVVMYELLAGRVPFMFNKQNSNPAEAEYLLSKAHKEQQPESIYALRKDAFERIHPGEEYRPDYPQWLEDVIMKCLAKNPKDRYKNGKELFDEVKNFIANKDAYPPISSENYTPIPPIVEHRDDLSEPDSDDKKQQGSKYDKSLPQEEDTSLGIDTGGIDTHSSNKGKRLFVIYGIVAIIYITIIVACLMLYFSSRGNPHLDNAKAEQIVVSEQEYKLKVGESTKITANVLPVGIPDTVVVWTISNPAVASVSNGYVTAKDEGVAIITATTASGSTSTNVILVVTQVDNSADSGSTEQTTSNNVVKPVVKPVVQPVVRPVVPRPITPVNKQELMVTETNFPDPVFRKYVLDKFDINRDGKLSQYEIDEVTSIEVSVSPNKTPDIEKIASLKGVEYFTNLKTLRCNSNQLTSLDVSQNTALTYLSCHSNQLTSLDVSKNTALTYLDCGLNQLTSLDVSQNTALKKLSCDSNQLTSLDVSKNTALTVFYCSPMSSLKFVYVNKGSIIKAIPDHATIVSTY